MHSILTTPLHATKRVEQFFTQDLLLPAANKMAFLLQFICHPKEMGAPLPCSTFTSKYLVRKISEDNNPKRKILEIGAGSGPITKQILPLLREGDEFHVVEYNPKLAKIVEKIVAKSDNKHLVKVHAIAIQEFKQRGRKFDHVVSTLPLNTFKPEVVKDFYKQLDKDLLADKGDFSYVELMGIPTLRLIAQKIFSIIDPEPYRRFRAITHTKNGYLHGKEVEDDIIMRNIPPIWVTHVQKSA